MWDLKTFVLFRQSRIILTEVTKIPGFDQFVVKYSGVFQVVLYSAKPHWQDQQNFTDNGSKSSGMIWKDHDEKAIGFFSPF